MPTISQNNRIETKNAWDWSPRHVRLRYQMLAVCAAFTVLVVFDHRQISLLFLGEVVSGTGAEDTIKYIVICVLALLGSIYSIITFFYRSETEIIEKKDLTKEHDAALEALTNETKNLTYNINSLVDRKWAPIEPGVELVERKIEAFLKILPELETMKSDYKEIRKVIYEYTKNVSSTEVANFEAILTQNEPELGTIISETNSHREMVTHGKKAIDRLNQKIDDKFLTKISNDLKPETIKTLTHLTENFKNDILASSNKMDESLTQMQGLTNKLVNTADILKEISDAANKTTKMHNRERITFGYKLPIWSAAIIVSIGVVWGCYRVSQYCLTKNVVCSHLFQASL